MEYEGSGIQHLHVKISLIGNITTIIAQKILLEWKRKHLLSFQVATSLALWLIPFSMAIRMLHWRFITKWILFSLAVGYKAQKVFGQPLRGSTFRSLYKWFNRIYTVTYVLSIIGSIIMFVVFIIIILFKPDDNTDYWMDFGSTNLYHGLFFGALGQDIAEIFISKTATYLGYPQGFPIRRLNLNICRICDNALLLNAGEDSIVESIFQLTCGHKFHEICIQGWCIVGKNQTCPYCNTHVNLKRMCSNKWENYKLRYGQLLNWLRWFVVFGADIIMNIIVAYSIIFGYTDGLFLFFNFLLYKVSLTYNTLTY